MCSPCPLPFLNLLQGKYSYSNKIECKFSDINEKFLTIPKYMFFFDNYSIQPPKLGISGYTKEPISMTPKTPKSMIVVVRANRPLSAFTKDCSSSTLQLEIYLRSSKKMFA